MEEPRTAVEIDDIKDIEAEEEEEESDDTIDKEKLTAAAEDEEEDEGALLFTSEIRDMLYKGATIMLALLLVAYLLAAFIIDFHRAIALFVCTVLCIVWNIYAYIAKTNEEAFAAREESIISFFEKVDTDWKYGLAFAGALVAIMVLIMAITVRDGRNMVSLLGLFVFVGLTWLFSWKPKKVKMRPIVGGIFIQFVFGYVVIRTSWGFDAIEFLADVFTTLLGFTVAGSSFVFDWLTDGSLFGTPFQLINGDSFTLGPPFFFNVLPSVIFFSALMSVGYYIRVIPWLVKKLGTLPSLRVFLVVFCVSYACVLTYIFTRLAYFLSFDRVRFGYRSRHIGIGVPFGGRKYLYWSDRSTFACQGKIQMRAVARYQQPITFSDA
jgi:hypothetical protein